MINRNNYKELIEMKGISRITVSLLVIILIFFPVLDARSQDNTDIRTRISMEYFNKSGIKSLKATLTAKEARRYAPLKGEAMNFYILEDTSKLLLGTVLTNEAGQASVIIPEDLEIISENEVIRNYEVSFDSTKTYRRSKKTLEIKDIVMEISFSQKNEIKLINLIASEVGEEGELIPLSDEVVFFYVPRTFTLLQVAEGILQDGSTFVDFPTTLPGDSLGNLTIIAKISEHDDYGNVETSEGINWGKPLPPMKIEHRGLGDVEAPLWMVYTLIILLSIVWFHYMYAIFTIYLIKREGKKIDIDMEKILKEDVK
jgi:hypothetical protein